MRAVSRLLQHGIAVMSVGVAMLLTGLLTPLEPVPSPPFLAAVAVSAWYGGLAQGLLATVLSVLALDFFFVPPIYSLGVGLADGIRLGVFGLVATLLSSLHAARRRIEESLRQRDRRRAEFLAVLAHELRNFLSPAASALEVLGTPGIDAETQGRGREILGRQVRNIARLVNDLLDVARIDEDKVKLNKEPTDLCAVVAHAVEAARPAVEVAGHRLEVCRPPGPVPVEVDPTRIEQVLVNLLTNAAKYTAAGGRVRVSLEAETGKGEARIRVRDWGAGIAADKLAHIFDLFGQAENGARGGLGIGLALARGLARLHGGDVTAWSDGPGKGSEFVVHLPRPKDSLPEGRVDPHRDKPGGSHNLRAPQCPSGGLERTGESGP
jgi:signal transduction histidine kinase